MIEITSEEHFGTESTSGVVVVDVYAPWCGPCKMITPALEELSKEFKEVKFIKVNADELPDVTSGLGVMSIPSIFTLVDGVIIEKVVGFRPKEVLFEQIQRAVASTQVD